MRNPRNKLNSKMSEIVQKESKNDPNTKDSFKRQGSFRKILPASSNRESQLSMSVKIIDRLNVNQNRKEYMIFMQEYNILAEYNILCTEDLHGIYVIPSAHNSFIWFGVQFIKQGIYQGGVFRFTISLPQNFPDGCPVVTFQSKMFHPLIDQKNGKLDTTWGFPNWKKSTRVAQLVQYITKVLTKLDTKMPAINEEASTLLNTNFEQFQEKAKQSVKVSLNEIFKEPSVDDPHYITFSHYNTELHDPIKKKIYTPKEPQEKKNSGFSWVQPGSLDSFSKLKTS